MYKKWKNKTLGYTLLWTLPVYVVAVVFMLPDFSPYLTELQFEKKDHNSTEYFVDLDNDNRPEKVSFIFENNLPYIHVTNSYGKVIGQYNSTKPFEPKREAFFCDYNRDNIKEILFFTQHHDSIFLNTIVFSNLPTSPLKKDLWSYRPEKFVSTIKQNHLGGFDFELHSNIAPMDINADGFDEFFVQINAGYSFLPRNLLAYDIQNDSLLLSPRNGIYTLPAKIHYFKQINQKLILNSNFVVSNYKPWADPIQYPDTIGWLSVLDSTLNYWFKPKKIAGAHEFVYLTALNRNDSTYIAACFPHGIRSEQYIIRLYDTNGREVEQKVLSQKKMGNLFHIASTNETERIILRNHKGEVFILNNKLQLTKKIQAFSNQRILHTYNVDLNQDGSAEFILLSDAKIFIAPNDFNSIISLDLPNPAFKPHTLLRRNNRVQVYFKGTQNDDWYFLTYRKNPIHTFRVFIFIFLFVLILAFIYFLIYIRTKNLEKENQKLAEIIRERTQKIENQKNELSRTNQKLLELADFKELMTSMIVHDLKNPLTAILAYSNNNMELDPAKLKAKSIEMLNLISSMLDVYKYEKSKMQINPEPLDTNKLIQEIIADFTPLIAERSITMQLIIPKQSTLFGEKIILKRVIENLLSNAIKYTPTNGTIKIKAEQHTNTLTIIKVIDSGEGIPVSVQKKLFTPFLQHNQKSLGTTTSTGLGLAFCKIAIDAHQGKIGVRSQTGKGAEFWFTVPGKIENNQTRSLEYSNTSISLNFNDDERTILEPFKTELFETEIFEISKILSIAKKIKTTPNEQVQKWVTHWLDAAYSNNQKKFVELLQILKSI